MSTGIIYDLIVGVLRGIFHSNRVGCEQRTYINAARASTDCCEPSVKFPDSNTSLCEEYHLPSTRGIQAAKLADFVDIGPLM